MANVINTRIQLKYDTLSNWNASTFKPLKGEVCIAKVDVTQPENSLLQPIMFKVGDGDHTFAELGWTSAKAADVYAWAKEASITVNKDGTGNVVAGIEWDATANGGKGGLKYTTASVATSEGLEAVQKAIENINKELDTFGDIVTHNAAEFATKSEFDTLKGKVEDEDGALAKANSAYELAETKLATATFTEFQTTNAQAIADAKSGAEATAAGELTKARGEITTEIGNAVAPLATTEELNKVKETANAAAPQTTTYTKTEVNGLIAPLATKEELNGVNTTATEAKTKIDTFLGTITPDGSADIIDTLAEINTNINENTDAFTGLSTRVTNIENGTTKAGDADKLDGHDSDYFATATALEGVKATAEAAAPKNTVYTKTEVDNKLGTWTVEDPTGEQPPIEATGLRKEIEISINNVNEDLQNYKLSNEDYLTHLVAGDQAVGKAEYANEAGKVSNKLTVTDTNNYVTGIEFDGSAGKEVNFTTLTNKVKANEQNISDILTGSNETKVAKAAQADRLIHNLHIIGGEYVEDVAFDGEDSKTLNLKSLNDQVKANKDAIDNLHDVATSGSIYDLEEVHTTTDATIAGGNYLIFSCGSASVNI